MPQNQPTPPESTPNQNSEVINFVGRMVVGTGISIAAIAGVETVQIVSGQMVASPDRSLPIEVGKSLGTD